jgi:leucyl aminopeptidase
MSLTVPRNTFKGGFVLEFYWGNQEKSWRCDGVLFLCDNTPALLYSEHNLPFAIASELEREIRKNGEKKLFSFPTLGYLPEATVLFALWPQGEEERKFRLLRQAVEIGRLCRQSGIEALRIQADKLPAAEQMLLCAGLIMGTYALQKAGAERKPCPVHGSAKAIGMGAKIGHIANAMRDLVNLPANMLTPELLAERATAAGADWCQILSPQQLTEQGYGAVLAVGQGSPHPPRLVILKHMGAAPTAPVLGLIGKGITFDSGGLCLKTGSSMPEMISDMEGAAAVLGAWQFARETALPINLVAVLALAENMPGGGAMRPGDVITTGSGKTVEVVNTDAEGRLILADGITAALKEGATALVDIATLTGAARIALGKEAIACLANDDVFYQQLFSGASAGGERLWRMPIYPEYEQQLKSYTADLKNLGDGKGAGMQVAGLFLKAFTQNRPWIHMDIGGCAAAIHEEEGYQLPGLLSLIQLCLQWEENAYEHPVS